MSDVFSGRLYYDTGELRFEGSILNDQPFGQGISYFKGGQKHMEGRFGDWFIEEGKEYYENGKLRFEGGYNQGPRNYYGPRYFKKGKLYFESGQLWFEGTFEIEKHGNLGYPLFKGSQSFHKGTEYDEEGNLVIVHGWENDGCKGLG